MIEGVTFLAINEVQILKKIAISAILSKEYELKKNYKHFLSALWMNLIGLSSLLLICGYGGLVIYKRYQDCDPLVRWRNDQIV